MATAREGLDEGGVGLLAEDWAEGDEGRGSFMPALVEDLGEPKIGRMARETEWALRWGGGARRAVADEVERRVGGLGDGEGLGPVVAYAALVAARSAAPWRPDPAWQR